MSTSEQLPVSPNATDWAVGLRGSDSIAPGVLSPAQLARMANEIFNELPDEQQHLAATAAHAVLPPNSTFTGNPYAAVPAPTAPAVPGVLASVTEAQHGSYIATPERSIAPDTRSSASSLPAVPGGGVTPTAAPEFAFLQDARPIFAASDAEPANPQASGKPAPSEDGFASIPASLSPDFPVTAGLSTTYANCSRRIWRSRFLGFSDFFFYRRCASALFWFASRSGSGGSCKEWFREQQSFCIAAGSQRASVARNSHARA